MLIILALALIAGGAWLAAVGGSLYYLLDGIALLVSGVLLVARRRAGLHLYALALLATLVWALAEAGLDGWALAPRLGLWLLLGLGLLTPWPVRALADGRWPRSALPLACTVAVAGLVLLVGLTHDPARIEGRLAPASASASAPAVPAGEWPAYGRTGAGLRYSPLTSITPANVHRLAPLWRYHAQALRDPAQPRAGAFEATPLKVGDSLYLCTPDHRALALNADTGALRWSFDPRIADQDRQGRTCRGLTYVPPPTAGGRADSACRARLILPTGDARLIALDPVTGHRCPGFGIRGEVDLWANMPGRNTGVYFPSSPPALIDGKLIVGGLVSGPAQQILPAGVVRAYDAYDGHLLWNWDPAEPRHTAPLAEGRFYHPNTPNSWSVASVDPALGLVYLPTGTPVPDEWGGNRHPIAEPFSAAIVALDVDTGQVRWHFQTVHHDLWDMDVPAQPSLVDLDIGGRRVPALVAPTKQGGIYVLDRRTGQPLLPVRELPAPTASADQRVAPTQPASALSFNPPLLTEADMWGATPFDQLYCRLRFRQLDYRGRYTPPSERGSLIYPGYFGVFNWGALAVDPVRQVAFTSPGRLAFISRLAPSPAALSLSEPTIPLTLQKDPFLSPLGLPCQEPPWGLVAGVDLRSGKVIWQRRNGTVRDSSPLPLPFTMGVPDLGGPILTAGGVAFMSGTLDQYLRAIDVSSGAELGRWRLPAGGQATPITYLDSQGRQIVLVVAGGNQPLGSRTGNTILAFALSPETPTPASP